MISLMLDPFGSCVHVMNILFCLWMMVIYILSVHRPICLVMLVMPVVVFSPFWFPDEYT